MFSTSVFIDCICSHVSSCHHDPFVAAEVLRGWRSIGYPVGCRCFTDARRIEHGHDGAVGCRCFTNTRRIEHGHNGARVGGWNGSGHVAAWIEFGRYHIIRLLGSGGMGHVYHAWDGELGEAVALKVIRGEYLTSPEAEARFKRELSISRQVTHKSVIRIYDLGDVDGVKFISMAFIDGVDLGSVIKTARPALELALDIAEQLCAGLEAAHQAGVVHCDLKPANIMVDKTGAAYLMDFGLACSLDADQYKAPGMMIGTIEYMSPEQATGKDADHRSDIFTLGIVLCELFTGERPYKGETQ